LRRHHGFPIRLAAALALLVAAPGTPHADPGGGAAPKGYPVGDDAPVVLKTPASKADRDRVRAKLTAAERALPKPSSSFRLAAEGEERGVGADAGKLDAPDSWSPIQAWTSRTYETRSGEDEERTIEVNLALNGQRGLSSGLASVGGEVRIVALKGALAVRHSIIGAEDGSRVALPVSSGTGLTLVRIYVVPPALESRLRRAAEATEQLPVLDDTHVTASRPDAIAAVIVEIRGEGRDVDALVPKVGVASLRQLLAP
jgi:hypothetical protein